VWVDADELAGLDERSDGNALSASVSQRLSPQELRAGSVHRAHLTLRTTLIPAQSILPRGGIGARMRAAAAVGRVGETGMNLDR